MGNVKQHHILELYTNVADCFYLLRATTGRHMRQGWRGLMGHGKHTSSHLPTKFMMPDVVHFVRKESDTAFYFEIQ